MTILDDALIDRLSQVATKARAGYWYAIERLPAGSGRDIQEQIARLGEESERAVVRAVIAAYLEETERVIGEPPAPKPSLEVALERLRAEENAQQRALGHLTILEVADRIEACGLTFNDRSGKEEEKSVRFEFCDLSPTIIQSWRGSYCEPALGWSECESTTARKLLFHLRQATLPGLLYDGYKGGLYQLSGNSPLWVDNWGQYSRTAIVDVRNGDYQITLVTRPM